jgi:hypothetical protein
MMAATGTGFAAIYLPARFAMASPVRKYRNLPDHAPIADSGRFFRMLLCREYSEKL